MSNTPEPQSLRVLVVEDDALDAELVTSELESDGLSFEAKVVDDEDSYRDALEAFKPSIVISDVSMPGFSGYRALDILREKAPATPFIFVSGTIGEETAIEALKRGATDYVLKGRMARLASAVRRAMRESEESRARERAENELVRAQRFESLGLLAGGLSHDLRNILQPLLLTSEMIAEYEDAELRKHGELVGDCARRGLEMVASMLSFARGARVTVEHVKLAALFESLGLLLRGSVPRNVEIKFEKPADDIVLEGNHTELQQCLLNLCLNALQAMPEGGTLTMAAEPTHVESSFLLDTDGAEAGAYLKLCIADTGIGMPDDVQANLFRPFFTTKAEGTGLGLISCKRIVTNHAGFLRVRSEPGAGTTFELYLPIPTSKVLDGEPVVSPLGNGERVLIVVEQAGKLSLMADTLKLNGYAVICAQSGAEAVQTIASEGIPDLLVMDSDMNLMTGVRTLAALLDLDYRGPVIMLVRQGEEIDREGLPPVERIRFVEKPVAQVLLLRSVREELDAAAADAARK